MHIERSKCGDCGFTNYNWKPLPNCEHYLTDDYNRIQMSPIMVDDYICWLLALEYKRKQRLLGFDMPLIDTNIWRPEIFR